MSALRVSVPGQPVRFVDLGPDSGRIRHTRGAVYGGVMVVAHQPKKSHGSTEENEREREKDRRYYAAHREEVRRKQNARRAALRPKCGKWMPIIKETCGRRPGHADSCRSSVVMEDERVRRLNRNSGFGFEGR